MIELPEFLTGRDFELFRKELRLAGYNALFIPEPTMYFADGKLRVVIYLDPKDTKISHRYVQEEDGWRKEY